jgi:hypothetical protein
MRRHLYEIVVDGDLRAVDREWLADLAIHRSSGRRSVLFGCLDQSALLGVLKRFQYLALAVFEVHRICGCLGYRASLAVAGDDLSASIRPEQRVGVG